MKLLEMKHPENNQE